MLDSKAVRDIAAILIVTVLVALIGGGVYVGITAQSADSRSNDNRDLIRHQCRTDLRQDQKLAVLVRAATQNPTLVPAQRAVYEDYLQSVEKESCDF